MSNRVPLIRNVFGEVVTYDPVITKFNPLFFAQLFLLIWNVVLSVIVFINLKTEIKFDWTLFGAIWISVDTVGMLAIWWLYRAWIFACSTLPFPSHRSRGDRTLVIGKPMHADISKAILSVTILYSLISFIFGYIFVANTEFKGIIEHTIELTLLQGLLTFSALSIISMVLSLARQYWGLANVQDVMVCIPATRG